MNHLIDSCFLFTAHHNCKVPDMQCLEKDHIKMLLFDPGDHLKKSSEIKRFPFNAGSSWAVYKMCLWRTHDTDLRRINPHNPGVAVGALCFIQAFKHSECDVLMVCIVRVEPPETILC